MSAASDCYGSSVRYEPVLCDFDGTLADSEPVIVNALLAACEELRLQAPDRTALRTCVGPPLEHSLPQVLGDDAPIQDVIESYRRHYIEVAPRGTALMPGVFEAVEAWRAAGIRVGVVSYKPLPILEQILAGIGLTSYLSVIRAPELGNPPDSKTALLQDALAELTAFRAQPVFIGDHSDDARAAHEVGIDFIRYPDRPWQEIQEIVQVSSPARMSRATTSWASH